MNGSLLALLQLTVDVSGVSLLVPSLEVLFASGSVWVVLGGKPVDRL